MKSEYSLVDKVVIITGGAGLIGKEFVRIVVKNGGTAIIADVDENASVKVVNEISKEFNTKNVKFIKTDITSKKSILTAIRHIGKEYGKIDALVNNAYPRNKNFGRKFENVSYEDFCENLNLHLGGYFLMIKEVFKVMKRQKFGNIINMASMYGFAAPRFEIYKGTKMTTPVEYSAIKGAIINLTKYLASYMGKHNIRVNSISPGGVFANQPKNFVENYTKKVVLGKRMANARDVAGALLLD